MRSTVTAALWSIALMTFSASFGAFAHEGEDHGNPELPRQQVAGAPRAEAASDVFELVAVARRGELTIFIDRFASNEPVANAAITVETPTGSIDAAAMPDGTYRLPALWSRAPGRYDLIFTVVSDGAADVLPLALQIPDRSSTPASAASSLLTSAAFAGGFNNRIAGNNLVAIAAGIGGFLLGAVAMALARRRRRSTAVGLILFPATVFVDSQPRCTQQCEKCALVAPVSGVIAEVNAVAGQIAQPNAILFQIVDPTRLWVEALSFDALTGTARRPRARAPAEA
jgi:cobalt-zinc-cadmium efflux system membrane fusion protein